MPSALPRSTNGRRNGQTVSTTTYQLVNDGSIPGILVGNTYKIPKANVISFFMDQKQSEGKQ